MKYLFAFIVALSLNSCKIADLRTSEIKNNRLGEEKRQYAKELLNRVVEKQGFNRLSQYTTYEVRGVDHWKGLIGKIANVWDWNNEQIAMRFSIGDFDGQVEALEGKKKGFVVGIQSWDYYEKEGGNYKTNVKDDERIKFILAANHYFFEIASRLSKAPFIQYIGSDQLNGKEMEKVFVSWGNKRTKAYDQYVLWIGKESQLIEVVTYTIRDNYLPMAGFLYSSIRFDNYRDVDGILIPFVQTVQFKNPKQNLKKYIHQFTISNFEWNSFPISDIRPFQNLKIIGDEKPKKEF